MRKIGQKKKKKKKKKKERKKKQERKKERTHTAMSKGIGAIVIVSDWNLLAIRQSLQMQFLQSPRR
jgi:hypothetical protein